MALGKRWRELRFPFIHIPFNHNFVILPGIGPDKTLLMLKSMSTIIWSKYTSKKLEQYANVNATFIMENVAFYKNLARNHGCLLARATERK